MTSSYWYLSLVLLFAVGWRRQRLIYRQLDNMLARLKELNAPEAYLISDQDIRDMWILVRGFRLSPVEFKPGSPTGPQFSARDKTYRLDHAISK